jgi:hypothetical protein
MLEDPAEPPNRRQRGSEAPAILAALVPIPGLHDRSELTPARTGRVRDDRAFLATGTQSWKLNHTFKGKLIVAAKPARKVALDGGLTMRVAGPLQSEIVALQDE